MLRSVVEIHCLIHPRAGGLTIPCRYTSVVTHSLVSTPMTKPLNIVDCASFNLRKASRLMAQAYDRYLQPSGLTNTQFTLLAVTSSRGPISITELAGVLGMDRTTLTRNLRLVEREGLLEVTAGRDARTRDVRLTAKGSKTLKQAMPLWQEAQTRVVEALGRAHWRDLAKELRAIAQVARSLD